jgi:hypothetical protein
MEGAQGRDSRSWIYWIHRIYGCRARLRWLLDHVSNRDDQLLLEELALR